jgi:hypothetical protein
MSSNSDAEGAFSTENPEVDGFSYVFYARRHVPDAYQWKSKCSR